MIININHQEKYYKFVILKQNKSDDYYDCFSYNLHFYMCVDFFLSFFFYINIIKKRELVLKCKDK